MGRKIRKRLYRGLLKKAVRVWTPEQIQETAVLEQVLAQNAKSGTGLGAPRGGPGKARGRRAKDHRVTEHATSQA